jgi:hypothetical protein
MLLSETETTANGTVSFEGDVGHRPIERLIAQLREIAETLEGEVRHQLEQSPTTDPADPKYPLLARSLGTRLGNLRSTLATLEVARQRRPRAA